MIYFYFINVIETIISIILIKKYLHLFQAKDYQNARFYKYFSKKHYFFTIICAIFLVFEIFFKFFILNIFINLILILINFMLNKNLISSKKTPLKFTNRVKRIYIISIILILVLNPFKFACALILAVQIFVVPIANLINIFDKIKNKKFILSAQKILKNSRAKVIAITGSNGKTSVKNILKNLLEKNYSMLATPKSYNTILGISKFINEEFFDCDYFIVEYGARRIGDIKKLCKIFGADYGIVTTIAPQHIETFKSIENVVRAKNELPKFLQNRCCVFNLDNQFCFEMFNEKVGEKLSVGKSGVADFKLLGVEIKDYQTEFSFVYNNKIYNSKTKLLGEHNVSNILLSIALAVKLGVKIEDCLNLVQELNFVPHRLELIRSRINILDDSYNCSLESAKNAIAVLKQFPNKKMIATPGIIEGGTMEEEINFKLGQMLEGIDYVVIIGNHNKVAINEGLNTINFDKKKILFRPTLEVAKQDFKILNDNDNLLLLNDLPDDYN